jgi:hypothetical protein
MNVIAQSGSAYLVEVSAGRGRVLDLEEPRLHPPLGIQSILARGYWEPFRGDPSHILDAYDQLEHGVPKAASTAATDVRGAGA